jgi:hypothetical protein
MLTSDDFCSKGDGTKLERRHEKSINDINAIIMMIGERFDRERRQHSLGLSYI